MLRWREVGVQQRQEQLVPSEKERPICAPMLNGPPSAASAGLQAASAKPLDGSNGSHPVLYRWHTRQLICNPMSWMSLRGIPSDVFALRIASLSTVSIGLSTDANLWGRDSGYDQASSRLAAHEAFRNVSPTNEPRFPPFAAAPQYAGWRITIARVFNKILRSSHGDQCSM